MFTSILQPRVICDLKSNWADIFSRRSYRRGGRIKTTEEPREHLFHFIFLKLRDLSRKWA